MDFESRSVYSFVVPSTPRFWLQTPCGALGHNWTLATVFSWEPNKLLQAGIAPGKPFPLSMRNDTGGIEWRNTEPMRFFDWDDGEPFFNYGVTSTACCKCCNVTCVSDLPPPSRTPAPFNETIYNITFAPPLIPRTATETLTVYDMPWYPTITCTNEHYADRTNCTHYGRGFGNCTMDCVTTLTTRRASSRHSDAVPL